MLALLCPVCRTHFKCFPPLDKWGESKKKEGGICQQLLNIVYKRGNLVAALVIMCLPCDFLNLSCLH